MRAAVRPSNDASVGSGMPVVLARQVAAWARRRHHLRSRGPWALRPPGVGPLLTRAADEGRPMSETSRRTPNVAGHYGAPGEIGTRLCGARLARGEDLASAA